MRPTTGASELRAAAGNATSYPIDDAAKRCSPTRARSCRPASIAGTSSSSRSTAARRLGWRRTTDTGLAETASFDGTTLTRRYAELGLAVTRPIADDDVALALAYLPIWIAEPAHYARWFEVKARGAREVTLSTTSNGKASSRSC